MNGQHGAACTRLTLSSTAYEACGKSGILSQPVNPKEMSPDPPKLPANINRNSYSNIVVMKWR